MAKLGEYYSILGTAQQTRFEAQKKELEEERKRARRDRYLGYLAKPVLGAISEQVVDFVKSPFEKKYEDFANSKFAIEQKVKDSTMRTRADAAVTAYENSITPQAKASQFPAALNAVTQDLIKQDPTQRAFLESDLSLSYRSELAEQYIKKQNETTKSDYDAATSFLAGGALSDNLKNRRSRTVFDYGLDIIQRDTTEKQDQRAEREFLETNYSKNRDAYEIYLAAKEEGASMTEAYEAAAPLMKKDQEDFYKPFEVTTHEYLTAPDGTVEEREVVSRYDRTSVNWKNGKNPVSRTTVRSEKLSPKIIAERELDLVRKANSAFNPVSQAKQHFTPEAYAEFKKRVKEKKDSITIYNPETMEDRAIITEVFDELDTPANMKSVASREAREKDRKVEIKTRLIAGDTSFAAILSAYQEAKESPDKKGFYKGDTYELNDLEKIYAQKVREINDKYDALHTRLRG